MVGDGLNSPRYQGGKRSISNDDNGFPDKYAMRYTRVLNLRGLGLREVPAHLFETARNEYVNNVDLENNQLSEVPWDLQNMSQLLIYLDLERNRLSFIPTFIWKFSRLTRLNLSGNWLHDLPTELGALESLCELKIPYNYFEYIPNCVYKLKNLEVLAANDNKIMAINATETGLGALRRLRVLKLNNNNIQAVPPVLGNMTSLMQLELCGNPFRLPRYETITAGTTELLNYLRDRIPL